MSKLSSVVRVVAVLALVVLGSGRELSAGEPGGPGGDARALAEGNNAFAIDLYKRLAAESDGNIVISPYSIRTALAMTYAGARGETAEQMAKVLRFTSGQERLHPAFGDLITDLQSDDKDRPYHLHVANSLWGQTDYPFRDAFVQLSRRHYRAGFNEVDFGRDSETARQAINGWVEERTRDKIKELLLPEDVNRYTRLVLTNALYFKATWKLPFPKDQIKDAVFHVSATVKPTVAMMRQPEGQFRYFAADDCQWIELPYKGDRLSMVILLPREGRPLDGLEKTLTAEAVERGLSKLHARIGEVDLPRFRLAQRCLLAEELKKMGMPLPFERGADFSGVTPAKPLWIHKAYIEVDEVGTEAAAATVVIGGDPAHIPFTFRADRPFLFLIRENRTGHILFLGRLTGPGGGADDL